ncbi:unnamed protein product [Rotaria magnacalcarata]
MVLEITASQNNEMQCCFEISNSSYHLSASTILTREILEYYIKYIRRLGCITSLLYINMAVELVWIVCPILFGLVFLLQTSYFIFKILQARRSNGGGSSITSIHMTDGEATCCMGWAWTSCIDKSTNRITLNTFIAWYIVGLSLNIIITLIFYFIIKHYYKTDY